MRPQVSILVLQGAWWGCPDASYTQRCRLQRHRHKQGETKEGSRGGGGHQWLGKACRVWWQRRHHSKPTEGEANDDVALDTLVAASPRTLWPGL